MICQCCYVIIVALSTHYAVWEEKAKWMRRNKDKINHRSGDKCKDKDMDNPRS